MEQEALKMREKTVCFTGHRIIPSEKRASLFAHLTDVITSLLEAGYRYFGAGGALGFDTLAAQAVLQLRTEYPQIRLILVLPCKEQTRGWLAADVDTYALLFQFRRSCSVYLKFHAMLIEIPCFLI